MPVTRLNFEDVSEADLNELVTAGASEGLFLEFKRQCYGGSDADKRELLKDVSAFANAHGGHIIIGMEEARGTASALTGIQVADPDTEVLRLTQIVRGGLDPDVQGMLLRVVRLNSGNCAVVIRISRSWRGPHRVSAQNSNRFWVRNSSGCHEASVDELRTMFQQSASAIEGARNFRDRRLELIQRGHGPRPLVGEGRFIFHIVPLSAILSTDSLDVQAIYQQHSSFMPIGAMGVSPRFNLEGVINERGGERNHGYTQVFRNGTVEATKGQLIRSTDRGRGIGGAALESQFFQVYERYLNGLAALGIQPPLILMITLEGVLDCRYWVHEQMWDEDFSPIDRKMLYLPDCLLNEYGPRQTVHSAIRPAFDALWNSIGQSMCRFYSPEGEWTGRYQQS